MKRGFFIGRFQPFHDGHRRVVERVADEVDELVVGIGSAGESHTVRDPFTGGERIMMITKTVFEHDLDLVTYAVPVEDIERNSVWVSHVESLSPRFDVAYANNPLVIRLFEEAGIDVERVPMFDREVLQGSEIRRRMIAGEPWASLVPDPVVEVIDEIDGLERLRAVARSDDGADAGRRDDDADTDDRDHDADTDDPDYDADAGRRDEGAEPTAPEGDLS